jgi:hypothetical protein
MGESAEQVCRRFGVAPVPCTAGEKLGISENGRKGRVPVHGLRIPPKDGTCGWFIWADEEMSDDPKFFVPLHVEHLSSECPLVVPYLHLPPGWRFLLAPGYEDVWFDEQTLRHRES